MSKPMPKTSEEMWASLDNLSEPKITNLFGGRWGVSMEATWGDYSYVAATTFGEWPHAGLVLVAKEELSRLLREQLWEAIRKH